MSTNATTPAPLPLLRGSDGDRNRVHIVGRFEHFLRVLCIKTPRALCGVLLTQDPDGRPVLASDPACPRCAVLAGWVAGSAS